MTNVSLIIHARFMALAGVAVGLQIGPLAVQARFSQPATRNAVVSGLLLFVSNANAVFVTVNSSVFEIVPCTRGYHRSRTMWCRPECQSSQLCCQPRTARPNLRIRRANHISLVRRVVIDEWTGRSSYSAARLRPCCFPARHAICLHIVDPLGGSGLHRDLVPIQDPRW